MPTDQTPSTALRSRGIRGAAGGAKRAPLPGWLSRASKRERGRAEAPPRVPAHVRVLGVQLESEDRRYIRRKLGMKLGKFASAVERVSVRVEDVNGPRGGVDHACHVKVVLSGLPSVVFRAQDASLRAAIDRALAGTERAVRRAVDRRRTKPLKARGGGRAAAPA